MTEERLKLAVFIDFDNIQIGVKDTLGKDLDVSLVLEALKERGEVVTKVAYGDWHRAGDQSRQMTQHAVQMVQRNVTPRGDKNGADINLALDALEMAFTRHHISAFAIVGGDSDFIALVEKLKQYDKRVFVVGGRTFTSNILQRNCHEFIAYENLLKGGAGGEVSRPSRSGRRGQSSSRPSSESRPLSEALPNIRRAMQIMAEREVSPQLGLLKSTLLQLDSTFSERDYGAGSFLEFMQKMEQARLVHLRRIDRGYLVEPVDSETEKKSVTQGLEGEPEAEAPEKPDREEAAPSSEERMVTSEEAMAVLKQATAAAVEKAPNRPLYLRQIRQGMRAADKNFDEKKLGVRGIVDLLHQAQREGWLRLQRDRKGILRILPASQAPAPALGSPAVTEPSTDAAAMAGMESALPDADVAGKATSEPQEVTGAEAPPFQLSPPVIEEAATPEASTERRVRRPRAARAAGKRGQRRVSARRKPKSQPTVTVD